MVRDYDMAEVSLLSRQGGPAASNHDGRSSRRRSMDLLYSSQRRNLEELGQSLFPMDWRSHFADCVWMCCCDRSTSASSDALFHPTIILHSREGGEVFWNHSGYVSMNVYKSSWKRPAESLLVLLKQCFVASFVLPHQHAIET